MQANTANSSENLQDTYTRLLPVYTGNVCTCNFRKSIAERLTAAESQLHCMHQKGTDDPCVSLAQYGAEQMDFRHYLQ